MKWKKINSKIVYKNPWIEVVEDSVIRPDGKKGIHQLTQHIWLRLFTKASTHILLRYAPQNIRYTQALYAILLDKMELFRWSKCF